MTQKEIVWARLKNLGQIDNLWAIQHRILRLGAIIEILRKEGYEIETEYNTPKVGKNTHYYFKQKPESIKGYIDEKRGVYVLTTITN